MIREQLSRWPRRRRPTGAGRRRTLPLEIVVHRERSGHAPGLRIRVERVVNLEAGRRTLRKCWGVECSRDEALGASVHVRRHRLVLLCRHRRPASCEATDPWHPCLFLAVGVAFWGPVAAEAGSGRAVGNAMAQAYTAFLD